MKDEAIKKLAELADIADKIEDLEFKAMKITRDIRNNEDDVDFDNPRTETSGRLFDFIREVCAVYKIKMSALPMGTKK